MKVLVTGAAGFVGRHLVRELEVAGHEVWTTDAAESAQLPRYEKCDIADSADVCRLFEAARPDGVVHLAGIASVPQAANDPGLLDRVNIGGTRNCLEALVRVSPGGRFLFASTAQVYGCTEQPCALPVGEDFPLGELSAYARSKVAGEKLVLSKVDVLRVFVARPSNHIGPGQSVRAFIPSIAEQARAIRRGEKSCFTAGNIASGRDFTDVRDVVHAYRLILENGTSGETYNISAGQMAPLSELFATIKALTGVDAPIEVNPAFVRPTDFSRMLDTTKVRSLGWIPKYSLADSLKEICDA